VALCAALIAGWCALATADDHVDTDQSVNPTSDPDGVMESQWLRENLQKRSADYRGRLSSGKQVGSIDRFLVNGTPWVRRDDEETGGKKTAGRSRQGTHPPARRTIEGIARNVR
jgi:hypothetical protein